VTTREAGPGAAQQVRDTSRTAASGRAGSGEWTVTHEDDYAELLAQMLAVARVVVRG
jgi:hypothetical protein